MTDRAAVIASVLQDHRPIEYAALVHHRTHRGVRLTFSDHRYLKGLYRDEAAYVVVKKATQSGYSEYLICRSIMRASEGRSIFYVLPTYQLRNQFVADRVERTVANTPFYQKLARGSRTAGGRGPFADTMSLKDFGRGTIALVGSNSKANFTSFAADDVVVDELDQCDQSNIKMAPERQAASRDKRTVKVSQPTIEGFGIDQEYALTDRKQWHIRCDSCGELIHPEFFKHVLRQISETEYLVRDDEWEEVSSADIHLICDCGARLDRFGAGRWVAENPKSHRSGYHVSKLFSSTVTVRELVEHFGEGMKDDEEMQRFYNGDLGVAYTAAGAKITEAMLDECVEPYRMERDPTRRAVMGIDVGTPLIHVIISELLPDGRLKTVYIDTVGEELDVFELYREYRVVCAAIDAQPETRMAKRLAARLPGMFYTFERDVRRDTLRQDAKMMVVDRTPFLDAVKESVLSRSWILPMNARSIPQFYAQMTAGTRVYEKARDKYVWVEGSKPDHYHHAAAFMQLARKLLVRVQGL